eukprot:419098_1
MLFTLIVSTLSCGLVFGADSPAPADPTLCGLPAIQDINLLPNHHGDKQLKYVIRRTSDVKIQDVNWAMKFIPHFKTKTNEDWVASISIEALMHGEEKEFQFVWYAYYLGDGDLKHSHAVRIKNGAVHK